MIFRPATASGGLVSTGACLIALTFITRGALGQAEGVAGPPRREDKRFEW